MNLYDLLKRPIGLIDSHAHLNFEGYDEEMDELLERAKRNNIEEIYDISVTLDSSRKSLKLVKDYSNVRSFIGIDPEIFIPGSEMFIGLNIEKEWFKTIYSDFYRLIIENIDLIHGLGETGLDHYWLDKEAGIKESSRTKSLELQHELFEMHLKLAKEFKLPLSIHSRGAEDKCIEIIEKHPHTYGIFHSFTGNYDQAKAILDLGWGLGINGIATFKNADQLRAVYARILAERNLEVTAQTKPEEFYKIGLYFETDSPFLSPEGKRGERNEPGNVRHIFEQFISLMSPESK